MKKFVYISRYITLFLLMPALCLAQDDEAIMKLDFSVEDSVKTVAASVMFNDSAAADVEVKFYVKRLFSLLPVGDATTDEDGLASLEFPDDIPADLNGKIMVIAKIEDDENLGNSEISEEINWGVPRKPISDLERSLAGSRENAPVYFIVIANLIIAGIWGTLIYVVLQLFKIRRISRHLRSAQKS